VVLGYPETALNEADDALNYARDIRQTASFLYALARIAWFHVVVGNYTKAAAQIRELMTGAEEVEGSYWTAAGMMLQGCLFAFTGKGTSAIKMITDGMATSRLRGLNLLRMPWYFSCMARAHVELGQLDDAWRRIGDAMTAMETTKETWQEPELHRIAGDLALMSPNPDAAKTQAHLDCALAIARRQQAKSWELRAAMSMARLYRYQGKQDKAHDLLASVYGRFTEGFETLDLIEAKALLGELA
jgi:hypothetical protein